MPSLANSFKRPGAIRVSFILAAILATGCATGRFAPGPYTYEIESLPGYEGTIEAVSFTSSEPRLSERRMVVYLPPSYYTDTLRRYPVMYLLHGARCNEVTWIERGNAFACLDSLRRDGRAEDFILVLPNLNNYHNDRDYMNGHCQRPVRSWFWVTGEAERYFWTDVVERVDRLYRTIPEKGSRAIAGMSSGGMQTIYLAANQPSGFDYVGLFSAYANPTIAAWGHPDVYGGLWPKLKRQFADPPASYRIYIGDQDIFFSHIKRFDDTMTKKGLEPHTLIVSPGGHKWYNWSAYMRDFFQVAFK